MHACNIFVHILVHMTVKTIIFLIPKQNHQLFFYAGLYPEFQGFKRTLRTVLQFLVKQINI